MSAIYNKHQIEALIPKPSLNLGLRESSSSSASDAARLKATTLDYCENPFIKNEIDVISKRMAAVHRKYIKAKSAYETLMKHKSTNTLPKSMMAKIPLKAENQAILDKLNSFADQCRVEILDDAIARRKQSIEQLKQEQSSILSTAISQHVEIIQNRTSASRPIDSNLFTELFSSAINSCTDYLYGIMEKKVMDDAENRKKKEAKQDDDEEMRPQLNEETIQEMINKSVNAAISKNKNNSKKNSSKSSEKNSVKNKKENSSTKNKSQKKNSKKNTSKKTRSNKKVQISEKIKKSSTKKSSIKKSKK
jgi:hypothetical protein